MRLLLDTHVYLWWLANEPLDAVEAESNGFSLLRIDARHAVNAGALPPHHRDPFDRMLVAQAQIEQMTLVTRDSAVAGYDVALMPA